MEGREKGRKAIPQTLRTIELVVERNKANANLVYNWIIFKQVGQIHGGLMGVIQRAMVKACPHIWFERSEVRDRILVARR